jgi:hypothetical protein
MFLSASRLLMPRVSPFSKRCPRQLSSRPGFKPRLETFEDRLLPSVDIWTGAAGDTLWSTATNWSTGTVPQAGDTVVFDNTAVNRVSTVDLPLRISNATITWTGTLNVPTPLTVTFNWTQHAGTTNIGAMLTCNTASFKNCTVNDTGSLNINGTSKFFNCFVTAYMLTSLDAARIDACVFELKVSVHWSRLDVTNSVVTSNGAQVIVGGDLDASDSALTARGGKWTNLHKVRVVRSACLSFDSDEEDEEDVDSHDSKIEHHGNLHIGGTWKATNSKIAFVGARVTVGGDLTTTGSTWTLGDGTCIVQHKFTAVDCNMSIVGHEMMECDGNVDAVYCDLTVDGGGWNIVGKLGLDHCDIRIDPGATCSCDSADLDHCTMQDAGSCAIAGPCHEQHCTTSCTGSFTCGGANFSDCTVQSTGTWETKNASQYDDCQFTWYTVMCGDTIKYGECEGYFRGPCVFARSVQATNSKITFVGARVTAAGDWSMTNGSLDVVNNSDFTVAGTFASTGHFSADGSSLSLMALVATGGSVSLRNGTQIQVVTFFLTENSPVTITASKISTPAGSHVALRLVDANVDDSGVSIGPNGVVELSGRNVMLRNVTVAGADMSSTFNMSNLTGTIKNVVSLQNLTCNVRGTNMNGTGTLSCSKASIALTDDRLPNVSITAPSDSSLLTTGTDVIGSVSAGFWKASVSLLTIHNFININGGTFDVSNSVITTPTATFSGAQVILGQGTSITTVGDATFSGGELLAQGTPTAPIVFSASDTDLSGTQGQWSVLILLGNVHLGQGSTVFGDSVKVGGDWSTNSGSALNLGPGGVTILGNYTQGPTGNLTFVVGQSGTLVVGGVASLNGGVNFVGNGSPPQPGTNFKLLTAGAVNGTFAFVNAQGFQIAYGPKEVDFVAV